MTDSSDDQDDFISLYLSYTSQTECPTFFHRWTALSSLAAWVGRDIYFHFGHSRIHANMYVMLVGLAGTKKSTAIKIGSKLLKQAGYKDFAADKTRQEKFLIDLAEKSGIVEGEISHGAKGTNGFDNLDDILDQNLFGESGTETIDITSLPPAEVFVAADEINNFIGTGNLDFMSILGDLWDKDEPFEYRLKNSKSVIIAYPTINLLGGNTFVGFSKLFPPEAVEQGFFSRMLFIHAEPVGRKYTIPPDPDLEIRDKVIERLEKIKQTMKGRVEISKEAYVLLDEIYMKWKGMDDPRFDSYENRRIIHLLKLAMLISVNKLSMTIDKRDIVEANTILTFTEHRMPKALGEFGKARNSDITHKVMTAIDDAKVPITFREIWVIVVTDLENRNQLQEIIGNLLVAEKVQESNGGFLPKKKVREDGIPGAVDWNLLTPTERDEI